MNYRTALLLGVTKAPLLMGILVCYSVAAARGEDAPFARMETVPPAVYAGQLFTIHLSVFTTGQDLETGMQISGLPDALQLQPFQELPAVSQTEGGRSYQVLRSRCDAVCIQPGRIQFTPVIHGVASRTVQTFFFVQRVRNAVQIPVHPITLEVKPIPLNQAPKGYGGLIGSFHLEAAISTNRVLPGDLVTLTCTLSGRGRFDQIPPLGIPATPGFKVYPPRLETLRNEAHARTSTQVFIPLGGDSRMIPALKLVAFNPEMGSFDTLSAGPFPLVEDAGRTTNQPSTLVLTLPGDANLGATCASNEQNGKAMLALLHAIRAQPRDRITRSHLFQLLSNSAIPFPPALPFWSYLTRNEWLLAAGLILALGLLALGFCRRGACALPARILAGTALSASVLAAAGAVWWLVGPPSSERVLTVPFVQGRLAPTEASAPTVRLTEGMVVTQIGASGAWVRVMAGNLAVWIPESAIEQP